MGRRLNPTGGQIALAAGAALIASLAAYDAFAKPAPKKKAKKRGPLIVPDNSDELPDNSKDGFLPKGKGYGSQIPTGMTSNDLWISDDCRAFIVGQDWLPTVNGLDPYSWMMRPEQTARWDKINTFMEAQGDVPIEQIPKAIVIDFGSLIQARYPPYPKYKGAYWGDFETYAEVGIYPTELPMVSQFALEVLSEVSPSAASCVNTIPEGGASVTKAQWEKGFAKWRSNYTALDYLLGFIGAASVVDIQAAIDSHESGMEF
jgi:hypothetical protein